MKILLYTNILTPYRKYFYDRFYEACQKEGVSFEVLVMAETEPNRSWTYGELKAPYTHVLKDRLLHYKEIYVHINPDLHAYIKAKKPDVVICAGGYLCPGVSQICRWKKKLGYRVFFWSESHLNESRQYGSLLLSIREWLRKKSYRRFDGFWFAGKLSRQFIEAYADPTAEYYFMPNLIEESRYDISCKKESRGREELLRTYAPDARENIWVCPARLSPVKGILEFLALLAKSSAKEKVTLLVAGEGELKEQIRAFAEENRLDVRLLGFQNQEQMTALYELADCFLMPSLSDPNPLTCIEALWSGLPLLVSRHVGNWPEVIREGENGYVFDYDQPDTAVERLETLVDLPEAWYDNAKAVSHEIASAIYDSKKVVPNAVTYFCDLIGRK